MYEFKEDWKPVVGFEGKYEVSDLGNVRAAASKRQSSQYVNNSGYMAISFRKGSGKSHKRLVHRVVMAAHVGPCPEHHTVNHIDCDKQNNHLGNLEYVTHSQNLLHAYQHGLRPRVFTGTPFAGRTKCLVDL